MPPRPEPLSEVATVISGNIGTNSGEKPEKKGGLREARFGHAARVASCGCCIASLNVT